MVNVSTLRIESAATARRAPASERVCARAAPVRFCPEPLSAQRPAADAPSRAALMIAAASCSAALSAATPRFDAAAMSRAGEEKKM
jgi:hypothetical protein